MLPRAKLYTTPNHTVINYVIYSGLLLNINSLYMLLMDYHIVETLICYPLAIQGVVPLYWSVTLFYLAFCQGLAFYLLKYCVSALMMKR